MAPMKRNRNRERKNIVRRRGKNSGRKGYKYSGGSDGLRVDKRTKRKLNGYKLQTTGIRNKRKYQRMGAGRYSKLARGRTRDSSDCGSDSKDKSGEARTKQYIRKALEFGLASGYLIPDENSGRQVLRVVSDIMQFGGERGASERSGSEDGADGSSIEGRGRTTHVPSRSTAAEKRLIGGKSAKVGQKNIRKRGRSRTKSPRKSAVQKRRRKQSASRSKPKARVQKRKRATKIKDDEPTTRRRVASDDDEGGDDDDDEPDPDADEDDDENKGDTKKLPVSSRPGSAVPNPDNNSTEDQKKGDDEPSEPSGEEGTDDEEEEEEEAEEGLETEDANEEGEMNKAEN